MICEDTEHWAKRKRDAAEIAVQKVMDVMEHDAIAIASSENMNRHGSEATTVASYGIPKLPYYKATVEKFIGALRYNLIFTASFDISVTNPDDEKNCYCPCSKYMTQWRKNFGVTNLSAKDKCSFHARSSPKGLMDHLRQFGQEQKCYMHRGIDIYLRTLYDKYWGDVGHKALYNVDSPIYQDAVAAETTFNTE